MTRIAYLINSVEGGGAALPAPSVIALLRREGFDVTVLALTRRDGRALPRFRGGRIPVRVRDGGERDHRAALPGSVHNSPSFSPTCCGPR